MALNTEFARHEPCYDRVLLVLTLDKQKMKERILIGTEEDVRLRLENHIDTELICDVTRPLGTLLMEFEHDPDGAWNQHGLSPLRDALHTNRWKQPALEQTSANFLKEKFDTLDPLRQYVAFRIWNDYLLARKPTNREEACERFIRKMSRFTDAFIGNPPLKYDNEGRPLALNLSGRFFRNVPIEDTRLELWYPDTKRTIECVAISRSLYPLVIYYLNRLRDWGLSFRKCKVCGRLFLANSLRYELCSEKCKKKQALQNKREFDERARENNYDLYYKNACQGWRNKINKVKKMDGFPPERLAEILSAFETFKKDALQRKNAVKKGTASINDFRSWLLQQDGRIARLTEASK